MVLRGKSGGRLLQMQAHQARCERACVCIHVASLPCRSCCKAYSHRRRSQIAVLSAPAEHPNEPRPDIVLFKPSAHRNARAVCVYD